MPSQARRYDPCLDTLVCELLSGITFLPLHLRLRTQVSYKPTMETWLSGGSKLCIPTSWVFKGIGSALRFPSTSNHATITVHSEAKEIQSTTAILTLEMNTAPYKDSVSITIQRFKQHHTYSRILFHLRKALLVQVALKPAIETHQHWDDQFKITTCLALV